MVHAWEAGVRGGCRLAARLGEAWGRRGLGQARGQGLAGRQRKTWRPLVPEHRRGKDVVGIEENGKEMKDGRLHTGGTQAQLGQGLRSVVCGDGGTLSPERGGIRPVLVIMGCTEASPLEAKLR